MNMVDIIGYKLKIIFKNNQELTIERDINISTAPTNYIVNMKVQEKLYTENQNPIGVITSSIVQLDLNSLDRSLVPENPNSPYYGLMDSTAEIEVSVKNIEDGQVGYIDFGRYFVSTWTGTASSANKTRVSIECIDIIGILMKMGVPDFNIKRNIQVVDFLNTIKDSINNTVGDKYKFSFNFLSTPNISVLDNNDIEASDVGTLFNIICQSCLLNMFVDRDMGTNGRVIKVLDTTVATGASVGTMSDDQDILSASFDKGALVGYTGVKVNYSIYSVNNISNIASVPTLALIPGENSIDNISVNNTIFKITSILIDTDSDSEAVVFTGIKYNRRSVTLKLNNTSSNNINCSINISGQTLNENKLAVIKQSTVDSNELLEVTNSIIPVNNVNNFATKLLDLINKRTDSVVIEGYFDPRVLKLNSIIQVNAEDSLYVSGKYRTSEITWTLGAGLRCKVRLVKQ